MKKIIAISLILNILFSTGMIASPNANRIVYSNPVAGATDINPETTITVRYSEKLNPIESAAINIQVVGSLSGSHSGKVVLSDDQKTAIFRPDKPFANGEKVTVNAAGKNPYSFTISKGKLPAVDSLKLLDPDEKAAFLPHAPVSPKTVKPSAAQKTYVTIPSDFPNIQVTVPASGTADGDLFFSIFNWGTANGTYNLILDNQGEPVYYQKLDPGDSGYDFKKLPNGNLSYYDYTSGYFNILDNNYHLIDVIKPGNGYSRADLHDLQLLPNGHYLFMIYDSHTVDMSEIVQGGNPNATVIGLVIQELDADKNVVFEWRSWDHFNITDTYNDLTAAVIDYVHGNAVDLDSSDNAGNILLSCFTMSEITKINRSTGDIIWRFGGKNNQFSYINGAVPFSFQHDIRRLPNGDITMFDNHKTGTPVASRVVEYAVDEVGKTVAPVWDYYNSLGTYSTFMGNGQRLPNGNTLIGWGSAVSPLLTEVEPDGTKAMEITLDAPQVSYRAFRFTWHGFPTWPPALVVQTTSGTPQLFFSWNGATEIASYRVYAGKTPLPTTLIAEQPKTSFETSLPLSGSLQTYCYFRVMPVDNLGRVTQYSDAVYNPACGTTIYVPSVYSNQRTANGQSIFSQR